ncbi:hypothetical protein [Paenibacillus sp. BAC0078]
MLNPILFKLGGIGISNLIPLKVPTGWTIHINELLEDLNNATSAVKFLKENLLLLSNPYSKRIIDVGWYPEGEINGEFCLIVVEMGADGINTILYSSAEDVIYAYRTKELFKLIDKINEILLNTP